MITQNCLWLKTASIVVFFILILAGLQAQGKTGAKLDRHQFYAEVYLLRHDFSSGLVSLNYAFAVGKKAKTSFRLGVYPDFRSTVSFPMTVTWRTNPLKAHQLEYGLGLVVRLESFESKMYRDIPAAMFPLMYRYQHPSGFFCRCGINLFYSWPVLPSPSLSLGYSF